MIDPLSKYFTWHEATFSETAARLGIDNTPSAAIQQNIKLSAARMDKVRELLGVPVTPNSWYRALELNRAVGGDPASDHPEGWAIDFNARRFGPASDVFAFLRPKMTDLLVDQLILEYPESPSGGWVHISFRPGPRLMAMIYDKHGKRVV